MVVFTGEQRKTYRQQKIPENTSVSIKDDKIPGRYRTGEKHYV